MNQTFHVREDWVDAKLKRETNTARRVSSGIVLIGITIGWLSESWLPVLICAIVLAFVVHQVVRMPTRAEAFRSLRLDASERGITFAAPGDDLELFYPWAEITIRANRSDAGTESITIEYDGKNFSTTLGIENMNDLVALSESARRGVT